MQLYYVKKKRYHKKAVMIKILTKINNVMNQQHLISQISKNK